MDNNALGKAIRKARGDLSLRDYAKKKGSFRYGEFERIAGKYHHGKPA